MPVNAKRMPEIISTPHVTATIAIPEPVLLATMPNDAPERSQLKTPDLPSRPPTPAAPVKTGVFGSPGQAMNAPASAEHLEVQTGGFGAPGSAPTTSRGIAGTGVRTGGFGDAARSGGAGSGNGRSATVADAGFGNANTAPLAPAHHADPAGQPAETPVEVLWKPKPVYTSEARLKKLEGSVTLEVIFRATGEVQVIRVVRGLGYGLDESARAAAEQIRFRPGKKDGVAVDRTGQVVITFELS